MNKIYTIEEVDELIKKHKKYHDEESALELFKAFEGFILKYTYFLKNGHVKINDKDLMSLAGLLGIKNYQNNPIKTMFDSWEIHDIFNELYLLFLICINQFVRRKEGPYFTGYLYNSYKYYVKDWISKLSEDILNTNKVYLISDLNSDIDIDENSDMFTSSKYREMENVVFEDKKVDTIKYDNICFTEKTTLTNFEKYILYLYYGKKIRDKEIAELLGIRRLHVNIIRNKAKRKLIGSGIILDDFEK